MPAPHFPVSLDLAGRRCLVIGTVAEAERKAAMLERAGAAVLRASGSDEVLSLDGVALVVIAGLPYAEAAALSCRCQARAIPVNVVDEPRLCSFLMPAVVRRGPVTVAISTGGRSPLLAKLLRQAIDAFLPHRLGELADVAGTLRPLLRERLPDAAARQRFWTRMLAGPAARLALAGEAEAVRAGIEPRLHAIATVLEIEQR